jgi:alpha-L-fucosidase 2
MRGREAGTTVIPGIYVSETSVRLKAEFVLGKWRLTEFGTRMDIKSLCSALVRNTSTYLVCILVAVPCAAADFKDVPYRTVDGVQLSLDAHVPDGAGPFPTAVLVHGGGWVAGDKEEYITYIFKPLSDAGFAWFSINYRLAPKFRFPADAEDVEAAIRWVKDNAATYHVDTKRIVLIGESAGGHLVSYVGAKEGSRAGIAAVVSMYGVHDFITASIDWKPIPTQILQLFGIDAVDARTAPILVQASPVTYVKKDMPPFLLMHGSRDEDVPYSQSVEMCNKIKQAGGSCDLITLEGAPHGMDHWEAHPEFLWYKNGLIQWLQKTFQLERTTGNPVGPA